MTTMKPASGRRIGETCRLQWLDWEPAQRIIFVRKMKDPKTRDKNKWCALTDEAEEILFELAWKMNENQATWNSTEKRIFPYNHRSVIAAYVEAKKKLGIKGLRLHDSRRETASRLEEKGYSRKQIALVTGHEPDSETLNETYITLRPEDFHRLQPAATLRRELHD